MNLSTMGRTYTIDFNAMQQINEDTGTARPVQRKPNPLATPGSAGASAQREGPLSRTSIYSDIKGAVGSARGKSAGFVCASQKSGYVLGW